MLTDSGCPRGYTSPGKGPRPDVFEQLYAGIRSAAPQESAEFAAGGSVTALVNCSGTHQSEGKCDG